MRSSSLPLSSGINNGSIETITINYYDNISSQECDMKEDVKSGQCITFRLCVLKASLMAAFLSLSALGKALSPTSLPNAEPTDCIKTVLLSCKSQLEHSQTQLPEDAIKIVSQGGATVKFVVT
jgi:hypothetical protein